MKAVLIIPEGSQWGNLIWRNPYLYPKEHLEEGIETLNESGFHVEYLEDKTGLAFSAECSPDEMRHKIEVTFRWMDMTYYNDETKVDFEHDVFDYAIVALPLTRLQIENPVITDHICLFPAGDFWVYNPCYLNGKPFGEIMSNALRDHTTQVTQVSVKVFQNLPLMVFPIKMTREAYIKLSQHEDVDLIKKCSRKAEDMMDLIRFYRGDYIVPEMLPARAGIWNDRHSAMYIYFPKYRMGHIQSREVELRTFIMGIGMDFDDTTNIAIHSLMWKDTNEFQNIIKHALRINTSIQEADNETMKFSLIMTLFEYIGDPDKYGKFQDMKRNFIGVLARDKQDYDRLSKRFIELTRGDKDALGNLHMGLRTSIVHLGKSIEDLIPDPKERKALFKELYRYIFTLIKHMMFSDATTWNEYDDERTVIRNKIM